MHQMKQLPTRFWVAAKRNSASATPQQAALQCVHCRNVWSAQASDPKPITKAPRGMTVDQQVLWLHNKYRARHVGTKPLHWDRKLAASALAYARQSAKK